jgi:hypothetical protein
VRSTSTAELAFAFAVTGAKIAHAHTHVFSFNAFTEHPNSVSRIASLDKEVGNEEHQQVLVELQLYR